LLLSGILRRYLQLFVNPAKLCPVFCLVEQAIEIDRFDEPFDWWLWLVEVSFSLHGVQK